MLSLDYLQKYHEGIKKLGNEFGTFNPFVLAEWLDVEIRYVDFQRKPLGQTSYIFDKAIVFLDDSLRHEDVRFFIAAHELGHTLLHRGLGGYYTSHNVAKGKIERDADCFSVVLLSYYYEEVFSEKAGQVSDIGRAFGMSEERIMNIL